MIAGQEYYTARHFSSGSTSDVLSTRFTSSTCALQDAETAKVTKPLEQSRLDVEVTGSRASTVNTVYKRCGRDGVHQYRVEASMLNSRVVHGRAIEKHISYETFKPTR